MSARLVRMMMLLSVPLACSHGSGSREADGVRDGGDSGSPITCPVTDSGRFEATPAGACMGVGSCPIELDNSCRPGVSNVPTTPPVYECQCVANQWQCVVRSGGLGIISCDVGGDAG